LIKIRRDKVHEKKRRDKIKIIGKEKWGSSAEGYKRKKYHFLQTMTHQNQPCSMI